MNYYILFEGSQTEPIVYRSWLKHINPQLNEVDSFTKLIDNKYYMLSAFGYPNYMNIMLNAITDIIDNKINAQLVIIVDAEDFTIEKKLEEINNHIADHFPDYSNYKIVVQTPSIEGWGLGNQRFISGSPHSVNLNNLLAHYNVRSNDPEEILPYKSYNKAQTSTKYLREAAIEKGLSYSKNNPTILKDTSYLDSLIQRNNTTSHINSLNMFLDVFKV